MNMKRYRGGKQQIKTKKKEDKLCFVHSLKSFNASPFLQVLSFSRFSFSFICLYHSTVDSDDASVPSHRWIDY